MMWYNERMEHKSNNVVYGYKRHASFCPEYRRKASAGGVDARVKETAMEVADAHSFEIAEMETMPGHAHILFEVDTQLMSQKDTRRIGRRTHVLRHEFPWSMSPHFVPIVSGTRPSVVQCRIGNRRTV